MELAEVQRTRAWRAVERHPQLVDIAFGLAVAVISLMMVHFGSRDQPRQNITPEHIVAAVVVFLAIANRRRSPLHVMIGTTAGTVALIATAGLQSQLIAALMVIAYTLTVTTDRRTAWLTTAGTAIALTIANVRWDTDHWWGGTPTGNLAWLGMAAAYGDATRSRRAYITAIEERAHRAEHTRDEEARRRVIEERLRIARELHDVVAHHIAVIKVQATGARHILERRPDQVAPALDTVSQSADAALREMATVVGLLRGSDEPATRNQPPLGLARLNQLLDDLSAHLSISRRQAGDVRDLPAVIDAAAYRILQEALTNAQKYGDGTADLTIGYTPDGLTLRITNPIGRNRTGSGSGYGIIGMRERAAAIGGTVTTSVTESGRFTVHASLPSGVPGAVS